MYIRSMIPKITGYIVRRTILLLFCVLIVGLLFTYATRDMSFINLSVGKLITLDNIESVQVYDGTVFHVTNKKGDLVVNKVVDWMNSAKIVEGTTMYPIRHGISQPTINIYDKLGEKGKYVTIFPAYNIESGVNGKGVSNVTAKNELVVVQGIDRFRIYSPELFNWFAGGWTKDK